MSPAWVAQIFESAMFFSTSALACASAGRRSTVAAMHCRHGTLRLGGLMVCLLRVWEKAASGGCLERVGGGLLLFHDVGGARLAVDGALDRFLGRAVVEFLDLLVVLGLPVDEHTDADEQVFGFRQRDRAVLDAV